MEDLEKLELEEFLEKLKKFKGRHTEMVSVLVPADYNTNLVAKQLEEEKGTATNIKSTATRKNVVDALERVVRLLKTLPIKFKNGLAVYCGNVSQNESQDDVQIFYIEPPMPLKVRLYRCDKDFVLEPLEEMLEIDEVYGLLTIDRNEATIGLLEGKRVKKIDHMTSGVPSKVRAGGQSSQRFHRITEGLAKEFFRRVAERMKEVFFDMPKLKGILVGGPIPTKEEFLEEGQLVTKLKEKVIGVKDIGYVDEQGLKMLVEASQDVLAEQEITKEKKLLERFFNNLGKFHELTVYKEEKVREALQFGAVKELFISKKYDKEKQKDIVKLAGDIGSDIHFISDETVESNQFDNITGGVGAILRFQYHSDYHEKS